MTGIYDGVTNGVSFPAFWALSPYSWTSAYGNQMQFNVMNMSIPPQIAFMAQNCMNPSFWSYYNYSMMSNPYIFSSNSNPAYQTIDPQTLQNAYQNAYNSTMEAIQGSMLQASFTSAGNTIATLKGEIETLLKDENLPADKKQQLENAKKQLEELEKKLDKLAKNEEGLSINQIKEQMEAYRGELAAIEDIVKTIKESITTKPTEPTAPTDATDPTAPTDTTSPTIPTGATGPTSPTEATSATEPTEPTPEEIKEKAVKESREITKNIYVAIEGPGTDEEKLESAIKSINKDNVVEVFDTWAINDYIGKTGDDSLMETIYDDVFSGSKRKEYTLHILNAFIERAQEQGVDISAEQAVIEAELGKWWRNDGMIYQMFADIHAKLTDNNTLQAVA